MTILSSYDDTLKKSNCCFSPQEDNSLTVAGLAERMLQQLAQFQAEDDAQLERDVSHWLADREVYVEAEEELKAELRKERREFYVDLDLDRRAHEQAIATLGYWNMKRVMSSAVTRGGEALLEIFSPTSGKMCWKYCSLQLMEKQFKICPT